MKRAFQSRKLESFRFFPIIAWSFVIAFAIFVYSMTINLKSATVELESQTKFLEATSKQNFNNDTNFEAASAHSR